MNPSTDGESTAAATLTIVVVTLAGGAALARCLAAVARIEARRIVVARPEHAVTPAATWPQFDWRIADAPVPVRRAQGVAAAGTEWVALVEDTCEPAASWAAAVAEIATMGRAVAWSGPVLISRELAPRHMALACTEYAAFAPANWTRLAVGAGLGPAHEVTRIPGLNLLYRRSALAGCDLAAGLVESDLHPQLQRRGAALGLHPGLAVTYCAADANNAAARARYVHGRIYGGGLAERNSWPARLAGAMKCLVLPAVLSLRALRGLPRDYPARLAACGWIVAFSCAWSVGECVGRLAGRGKSILAWA